MNISYYIIFFAITLLITLLGVPINIRFSKKTGLMDNPCSRSIHSKSVALAGGLSFAIPIILCEIVLALLFVEFREKFLEVAVGSIMITFLGFMDDKKQFTARYKLIFQIAIASFMYFCGYRMNLLTNPFGNDIVLKQFSYPFTVIWYVIVINAINLIDGIDGLAAGICAIVAGVILAVGLISGNSFIIILSVLLLAGCLGFLKYNFFPAKIFMGDTGALFLGFTIATICIAGVGQFKGITAMTLMIPISALGLPLMETTSTIFRRMRDNRHIFHADKEHIHHKLLDMGFSQRVIAIVLYFVTFLFGLIAIGFSFSDKKLFLVILLLLVFILFILINILYSKESKK